MGLAVEVGTLAFCLKEDAEGAEWIQKNIDNINKILVENGISPHSEPTQLPELHSRAGVGSYPYSFLHYLRRFYARMINDPQWVPTPVPEGEDPSDDDVLDEESCMFTSHLLCHSDCEGYYVPVDFSEVIVSDNSDEICGCMLCSSYRLLEELVWMAPKLGISVTDGVLSDEEARRINRESFDETNPFFIELTVWISLFEAARLSIEHKTAVRFC